MGSTHVEEQNEQEGRIKRVALRAAAKNGDPCFPQPVFLGSLLFSSELKDFLETAWVLWLEGPEVTDRWEGLLWPAEPAGFQCVGNSGLFSCGVNARIGEVLK